MTRAAADALMAIFGMKPVEDGADDVHVTPMFGDEHATTVHCWCHPRRDSDEPRIVVHRVLS